MARLYAEPMYRGFCSTAEDPYGTAEAASTNAVKFMDVPTMPTILEARTDADEYTGAVHRMEHSILKQGVDLAHSRRLLPWEAGLFYSLLGGSTLATGLVGTAYVHTIENDLTDLTCKSVTMWEESNSYGQKEFPGIACTQVEVTFERGEFCMLAATLVGDGSEAAGDDLSSDTPEDTSETYLRYGDVDVLFGGVYSEAGGDATGSIAGGSSKKAIVRSGTITIKNDGERQFELGSTDIYASSVVKGDLKADDTCVISLEFEPADSTELDYLLGETEFELEITIAGADMGGDETGHDYTVAFFFPVCRVVEATMDRDGSVAIASLVIHAIKDDPTADDFPFWQVQVRNKKSAYLA